MNSSQADSRVNCLKTSGVSETHAVSILRESGPVWSARSLSLRMETQRVSEKPEVFQQLTRLSPQEAFKQFCHREA
jgi:hypothetical protein